jgi:hypothetical protein
MWTNSNQSIASAIKLICEGEMPSSNISQYVKTITTEANGGSRVWPKKGLRAKRDQTINLYRANSSGGAATNYYLIGNGQMEWSKDLYTANLSTAAGSRSVVFFLPTLNSPRTYKATMLFRWAASSFGSQGVLLSPGFAWLNSDGHIVDGNTYYSGVWRTAPPIGNYANAIPDAGAYAYVNPNPSSGTRLAPIIRNVSNHNLVNEATITLTEYWINLYDWGQ